MFTVWCSTYLHFSERKQNIDLVYKYIVQKLYGFPYKIPAVVVEKDAVFIPAGWDNDKKIGILHENFQTLKAEDNFEDIITKPPVRKFVHEKEIVAEDDQVFLMKLQSLLAKQPPTAAGRPVDASPRVPGGSLGHQTDLCHPMLPACHPSLLGQKN